MTERNRLEVKREPNGDLTLQMWTVFEGFSEPSPDPRNHIRLTPEQQKELGIPQPGGVREVAVGVLSA